MNYDTNVYTQVMMKLLEPDISFVSSRYFIPNYEKEDLAQELRLLLWQKLPTFDPYRGISLRTYACNIMRNRLKDLLKQETRQKRGGGLKTLELPEDFCDIWGDFDDFLDALYQVGLEIEDFF